MSYFSKDLKNKVRETMMRRPKKFLMISADYINHKWTADLIDYKGFSFRYILTVIDVYSRKAGAWTIKTKDAETVLKAFKKIIEKFFNDNMCEQILLDDGGDFKSCFKEFLEKNKVVIQIAKKDNSIMPNMKHAQSIAERFNRTLRGLLRNYKEEEEVSNVSLKDIHLLVKAYNNHAHRHLEGKDTPIDIYDKGKKKELTMYSHNIGDTGFKIGDKVRLLLQKDIFSSKKLLNYSKTVYEIIDRNKNRFTLNDGNEYPYTRLRLSKEDVCRDSKADEKIEKRERERKKKNKKNKLLRELR